MLIALIAAAIAFESSVPHTITALPVIVVLALAARVTVVEVA
jgi:hypothetical protein